MCLVAQLVDVTGRKGTKYDGVTLVRPRDTTCSGRALQDYDLAHAGALGGDRKTFPCKEQTISFLLQKLKMIVSQLESSSSISFTLILNLNGFLEE